MTRTEPLVSELAVDRDGYYAATIIDQRGRTPTGIDMRAWRREMDMAVRVLHRVDPGGRQMVVVHPEGYGHR